MASSRPAFAALCKRWMVSLCFILVATGLVFVARSFADDGDAANARNYSVLGTVSALSATERSISISYVAASDGSLSTFDLHGLDKLESRNYNPLSLEDVMEGDKVILQGLENNGTIRITRLIDFSWTAGRAASSTNADASSTPGDDLASTTDAISTSTPEITASSTDAVASSTLDVTASSTPAVTASSTDAVASSTPAADTAASSTDDTGSAGDQPAPSSDTDASASTTNP